MLGIAVINRKCSCTPLCRLSILEDMQAVPKNFEFVEVNLQFQIALYLLLKQGDGESNQIIKSFFKIKWAKNKQNFIVNRECYWPK